MNGILCGGHDEKGIAGYGYFFGNSQEKISNVIVNAEQYRKIFGYFTISTITVLEIVKGFHKMNREEKLLKFLSTVTTAEILTLDIKSAEIGGRIYADLERTGQPVGRADPMIAGIALTHDLILSTGNTGHYQRIKDLGYNLKTENWKSL